MTPPFSFSDMILMVILVFFVVLTFYGLVTAFGDSPDDYVWVGGDKGLRQVPIYYVDNISEFCVNNSIHIKGCYKTFEDIIIFVKNYDLHFWALPGCTIWDHEIYHAWGYDHVEMNQFNCPHPNTVSHNSMQFEEGNQKHWNPNYEWNGYGVEHRTFWK